MISLNGKFWHTLRSLFLFIGAAVSVTFRRLAGQRVRPTWTWLVEVAVTFLRSQGRQAARLKRMPDQRAFNEALSFRPSYAKEMKIASETLEALSIRRFLPPQTNRVTMLYLHGGGYVFYNRQGDQLIGHIAQAAQAETLVPDYRLAPENPYPAALEDALDAYRELLVGGADPQRLIVAGDSAGGGLAVAMLQRARRLGLKMPALAILLSPWVDLTGSGKSMESNAPYDLIFAEQLRAWAAAYAGSHDLADPSISPLFARDLQGLPPLLIQCGKSEILYDSIVDFSTNAKAQGVEVLLDIYSDMPHDFQAFAERTPQSLAALQRIRREVWRRLPDPPPQVSRCLPDLAIFRAEVDIPFRVFEILWAPLGISNLETHDVLDWLVQRQRINSPRAGVYSLAPHQLSGLQVDQLPERHQRLLNAYREQTRGGWHKGPQDGYYFQNLTYHLHGAGWQDKLSSLLLEFDWLWMRLKVTNIAALIHDFSFLQQPLDDHQLVLESLRLSEKVLEQDKTQLPAQLRGRLLWIARQYEMAQPSARGSLLRRLPGGARPPVNSVLPQLMQKAYRWNESAWLCPMNACLIAPNGPKEGRQTSPGLDVAISANHQRALSVVDGRTIRVWDVASGAIISELHGHTGMIYSLAIDAKGRTAISAGEDSNLLVWDLESGKQRFALTGHQGRIWKVSLTPNGKEAVSVGDDGVLHVWDLHNGIEKRTLRGFEEDIHRSSTPEEPASIAFERLRGHVCGALSVALTPDGRRAISGGPDGAVRIWDLVAGQELNLFREHKSGVHWVGIAWHGRRAFSISNDRALRVWDLDRMRLMHTFEWPVPQPKAAQETARQLMKALRVDSIEEAVQALRTGPQNPDAARLRAKLLEELHFPPLDMLLDSLMNVLNVTNLPAAMEALARLRHRPAVIAALDHLMDALHIPSLDKAPQALQAGPSNPYVKTALRELLDALNAPVLDLQQAVETVLADSNENAFGVAMDASLAVLPVRPYVLERIDLEKGSRRNLGSHARPISAAAIDSDGMQAVSASLDSTVKLWDLASGECLTTYYCNGEVTFCAMSPYGQLIVAGDQAGFLHFLRPMWPG